LAKAITIAATTTIATGERTAALIMSMASMRPNVPVLPRGARGAAASVTRRSTTGC
jgi:hypothetical protein